MLYVMYERDLLRPLPDEQKVYGQLHRRFYAV